MNEEQLRNYIRKIFEATDEPKRKKKQKTKPGEVGVSVGRGRWNKDVAEAGALAKEDPAQLMKNLKIKDSASGYQGVEKILDQALGNSPVMRKAYKGMSKVTSRDKAGIKIEMNKLDNRNGAKYLHHTLVGAINAKRLTLDVPLQIDRLNDGSVVVYSSPDRNSWEESEMKGAKEEKPEKEE